MQLKDAFGKFGIIGEADISRYAETQSSDPRPPTSKPPSPLLPSSQWLTSTRRRALHAACHVGLQCITTKAFKTDARLMKKCHSCLLSCCSKYSEFALWASEVMRLDIEVLPKAEEKELFRTFCEDFNTATLPHQKYYSLEEYERKRADETAKRGLSEVHSRPNNVLKRALPSRAQECLCQCSHPQWLPLFPFNRQVFGMFDGHSLLAKAEIVSCQDY